MSTTTQITHINGLPIIAREQAHGPHPHPRYNGRIVPITSVIKVLLEDGSETYLCDRPATDGGPCGYHSGNVKSVTAHQAGGHTGPRGSMYPEETIRRVAQEVHKAKRRGGRGFCEAAAQALNEAGIPTVKGDPWKATTVSSIWNHYGKAVRVRLPRPASVSRAEPIQGRVVAAGNGHIEHDDIAIVRQFVAFLPRVGEALLRVADQAEQAGAVSQEIADKARRYDEIRRSLGGL
jgi:hypothetical protein